MADSTASPYAPGRRGLPRPGASTASSVGGSSRGAPPPVPTRPLRGRRLGSARRVGESSSEISPYRPTTLTPLGGPRSLAREMQPRTPLGVPRRRPARPKPALSPRRGPPIALSDDDDDDDDDNDANDDADKHQHEHQHEHEPRPPSDVSFDAAQLARASKTHTFTSSEDETLPSDMIPDTSRNEDEDRLSPPPPPLPPAAESSAAKRSTPSAPPPRARRPRATRRRQGGITLPLVGMTIREVLVWRAPPRKTGSMTLYPNRRIALAPLPLDQHDAWPICPCDVQVIEAPTGTSCLALYLKLAVQGGSKTSGVPILSRYLSSFDLHKLKQPPNPASLDLALHFSTAAVKEWDTLTTALEQWTDGVSPPQFIRARDPDAFRQRLEDFARCDAVATALAKPRSSQTLLPTVPAARGTSPSSTSSFYRPGSTSLQPDPPVDSDTTRKRPLRDQPPRASKARVLSADLSNSEDDQVAHAIKMVRKARMLPPEEEDTTILRFPPQGGRGSVSLKRSDMLKLEEGEWLNDSIIDFVLKYLHSAVEESLSEEEKAKSEDIMVLSPFFYSQLTSAKKNDRVAGYEKVRKWIKGPVAFQRRYIVVPINEHLHWYLAIILHPERMLHLPPDLDASNDASKRGEQEMRSSQRLKGKAPKECTPVRDGSLSWQGAEPGRAPAPPSIQGSPHDLDGASSATSAGASDHGHTCAQEPAADEERPSHASEDAPTSAEATPAPSTAQTDEPSEVLAPASSLDESHALPHGASSSNSDDADQDVAMLDVQPGSLVGGGNPIVPGAAHQRAKAAVVAPAPNTSEVQRETEGEAEQSAGAGPSATPGATENNRRSPHVVEDGGEERSREKAKDATEQGQAPVKEQSRGPRMSQAQLLRQEKTLLTRREKARDALEQDVLPVIITFDSLRGRNGHQKVNRDLSSWLRLEAVHKAGVTPPAVDCKYLDAILPQQPNWWDCGIYVIHFFHRFILDPQGALRAICGADERDPFWHAEEVGDKRAELKGLIRALSEPWLAQQTKEESDDDAVQMVERTPEMQ